MRSITKLFARLVLVLVALAAFAAPALAAAPNNDTFPNAKLVTLGFSATLDTTQATTDSDDAPLLEDCGPTATDASVWYAYDGDGTRLAVDTRGSNYSAGVIVATGSRANLEIVTCGPERVTFSAEVGTRYYVLVFDDQTDETGNGGTLHVTFRPATQPNLEFNMNAYGGFNTRTAIVKVSGSYSCTAGEQIDIFADASQRVGRGEVVGSGEFAGQCDGTLQQWTIDITSNRGKFAGGKLQIDAFAIVCGDQDECAVADANQTVKLRGRK